MKKGKEKKRERRRRREEERARQEVLLEQRLYSGGAKQGLVSSLDRNFRRPSTIATRKERSSFRPATFFVISSGSPFAFSLLVPVCVI